MLTHQQVTLFFLQLGALLLGARLLGELAKRFGQPPVLGELLVGILLGPSLLGWAAPEASRLLFPSDVQWRPLLETVAWIGLGLLMLLTGLETDVRLLRSLGKPAFLASAFGLLIPFASGLSLGFVFPESLIPSAEQRLVTALFFATAMSVSAMPVIAKILMDLDAVKRNVGVITLTAAVVDDTVGWILLAAIVGIAAAGQLHVLPILKTLGYLALFLVAVRVLVFPIVRRLLRSIDRSNVLPGTDLVLVVALAFLFAAATERIGVHAVFGAFVAGALLRQCPTLSHETLRRLEAVSMAVFAPFFFAFVGLKVDFTQVQGWQWPAIVLGVAVGGKILGCVMGGVLGKMRFLEALALGCGMSARGAMGLVVAMVGLNAGVIGAELFALLVLMSLATSVLAPITMKPLLRRLPLTEEEVERTKRVEAGFLPRGHLRILVPVSGGANAVMGCHIAANICREEGDTATALYIETEPSLWKRLFRRRRREVDLKAYFDEIRAVAKGSNGRLLFQKAPAIGSVQETILGEIRKGHSFLFLGASGQSHPVYDPFVSGIVRANPCHVVIVRGYGRALSGPARRILVPTDGSFLADAAFQIAAAYAERTQAKVVALHVVSGPDGNPLLPSTDPDDGLQAQEAMLTTLRAQFAGKIRPDLLECRVRAAKSLASAMAYEVLQNEYDLAVVGAENKSIVERVYLGRNVETILDQLPCPVAIVIPKVAGR